MSTKLSWGAGALLATAVLVGCTGSDRPLPSHVQEAVKKSPPRATAEKEPRREPLDLDAFGLPYPEWQLHDAAVYALGRIGPAAVSPVREALFNADPRVRRDAADILARIGPSADAAVPDLIQLVQDDPDAQVRKAAARALGQIGPAASEAVAPLVDMLIQSPSRETSSP